MMRLRMKLRLGLIAVVAVVCVVMGIYLFILPRLLPTGYEEIARLRQADLKAEGEEAPGAPLPPQGGGATHGMANRIAPGGRALPSPALGETPRQKFQRCWAAVMNYNQNRWPPEHQKAYFSLYSLLNDAQWAMQPTQFTVRLTKEDWAKISQITSDTQALTQALRRIFDVRLGLKTPLALPPDYPGQKRLTAGERTVKAGEVTGTPPLREAAELLTLPDGAIPTLPTQRDKIRTLRLAPILAQAYLYALAHDPAFDAGAGLRRIRALQHYARVALFPYHLPYEEERTIKSLIQIMIASGPGERRQRAAVAAELARLAREEREWAATIEEKLHRYKATCVHDDLSQEFEEYLTGRLSAGNTFHYLLGGKPERIWMRMNAENIRRHIEQYAVALARGSAREIQTTRGSLYRALNLVNVPAHSSIMELDDSTIIDSSAGKTSKASLAQPIPDDLTETGLLLALKAYWDERRQLPSTLDELPPDYLPAPDRGDGKTVFWIEVIGGQPALMKAAPGEEPFDRDMLEAAQDPKRFRETFWRRYQEMVRQRGDRHGPTPTDGQIEEERRKVLEVSNHVINLTGIPLEFTTHY